MSNPIFSQTEIKQNNVRIICEFPEQTDMQQEARILQEVKAILSDALQEYLNQS